MIDLSKRFALLETGEIEPLFYEDGDPRDAYEDEDGKFYLCHDVYFESPGIRGWALRRDEIIATSDNEDVLAEITAFATMPTGGLTMDEVYISQWEALNCFEDWEDSRGRFHWAHEDRTYQAIEKLPPADVIPAEWILKQDGGDELIRRWNEYKEECK